ncbi:hypothetical protein ALQ33_00682 [Pseudomonas syringae pv. philadelphi]|uniref:Permease of the major facilitator superfamily n=1 Tax=Pseudomonas syringae pv. philadelphi TaxID=251706 RepID=A0A3M3YP32_9PSED|nr:hypothetical protein [Pseudomonas syringae group genomosp. 3]RMO84318.1 hypothetical protein ALQ33_00682 [Pseudomonas syringae pv. philadelphi]
MIRDDRIAPGAPVYQETHAMAPLLKRISWSAILAGVVLAMVVSLLLNLLGTAIGSASIDPMQEANPLSGIGTGAGIWVVVSSVISLFVGGWAASRLAQREGAFHGLLVWASVSLITVYLVSSAVTGVVRGGLNLAGSGMSALGSGIAQVAPAVGSKIQDQLRAQGIDFNLDDIQGEIETAMRQTGKPELNPDNVKQEAQATQQDAQNTAKQSAQNPQQADEQLGGLMDRIKAKGDQAWDAADRQALVNLIKARGNKTDAEANQIVDQAQASYRQAYAKYQELKAQAEQKAREAAEVTAKRVSQGAWILLITLVISGLVAAGAGVLGRRTQPPAKVVAAI